MIGLQPLWQPWVTGRERFAAAGASIVVANHRSMLDIPLLFHLADMRVVARPGVFKIPGIGLMARLGRHVEVEAGDEASILAARERIREALGHGLPIALFPEGTRGDGRTLQPFQRGVFQVALDAGLPVVPVAISGSADALQPGSPVPRKWFARMHVQVLEPVPLPSADDPDPLRRRRLAAEVRGRIAAALDGPRPWEVAAAVGQRYRRLGRFREGWARGKVRFDPVFWMLHERLPTEGRIVDLGAGEGLLGWYLHAAGHRAAYDGYDLDDARLDVGRATVTGTDAPIRLLTQDARRVDPGRPDAIVCIDVLHYLGPEDQAGLLSRMCAALPSGGALWVRDPEPGGRGGALTVGSEKLLVAAGRHQVAGDHAAVRAMGGAWIKAQLERYLTDVQVLDGSPGTPFHNVLVGGRKP